MLVHGLLTNENYHWETVGQYLFSRQILEGVGWTIFLTFASMAIAIVLAVTLAIMRRSENPVLRWVSWAYIWFFRGTPVYTQLVFWGLISVLYPKLSLGVPFGPEWIVWDTQDLFTAARAAVIGLALNEAAYLAEIVRAGLESVDPGQDEAAQALGMRRGQIMRRIVLPQAMRIIVPPTGNETISMLKTTSLVLAVPFTKDLTYAANAIASRTFQPIPLLLVAAIWYLVITSILMAIQSRIERHYGRGFTGQAATPSTRDDSEDDAKETREPGGPFVGVTP